MTNRMRIDVIAPLTVFIDLDCGCLLTFLGLFHTNLLFLLQHFHRSYSLIITMPLVVPGVNSSMGDKSEWVNKLIGKKLSETTSDVNVCP